MDFERRIGGFSVEEEVKCVVGACTSTEEPVDMWRVN